VEKVAVPMPHFGALLGVGGVPGGGAAALAAAGDFTCRRLQAKDVCRRPTPLVDVYK
jgi:hypothetical protein